MILSDEFAMPFQEIVNWPSFSIKWPMDNVGSELLEHLRAIPMETIARVKKLMQDAG